MASSASQVYISPIYRVFLLYIEPFSAFYGAVLAARSPLLYLSVMSPHANTSHYHPELQVIFDQLAATYFLFAFNQGVVLRVADGNLRVWNALIAGMLFCDVFHILGTGKALGWAAMLDPASWRLYDWVNLATLYGAASLRIAFLSGVGVRDGGQQATPAATAMKTRSKTKAA